MRGAGMHGTNLYRFPNLMGKKAYDQAEKMRFKWRNNSSSKQLNKPTEGTNGRFRRKMDIEQGMNPTKAARLLQERFIKSGADERAWLVYMGIDDSVRDAIEQDLANGKITLPHAVNKLRNMVEL